MATTYQRNQKTQLSEDLRMNANRVKSAVLGMAMLVGGLSMAPTDAQAFCGFYVSGGEASLFNDATQVALLRHDTKTVLSMQNNYKGPVKDFAMVVPVPVILQQEDVKTLNHDLFKKIDTLSAPRLVEYWEQDPCAGSDRDRFGFPGGADEATAFDANQNNTGEKSDPSVKIEAKFEVGEYDIVVLSATEANALDTWLRDNKYNIPEGAEAIFNQYIQQGMYFFVAKINPAKVKYSEPGKMILSPLRFAYDSETFSLPIRLGMVNAKDKQDLIVYILSQNTRYEVANYPNTTIPTNLEVSQDVKKGFGDFYVKLFDKTMDANPNAVVTEYSWASSSCDPCPGPVLDGVDLGTLGVDVVTKGDNKPGQFNAGWTLTRLHARYSKDGIKDDLVFKKADPIVGGREVRDQNGLLERDVKKASGNDWSGPFNNFQGRYIMRNRWSGPIACDNPQFGRWGGPPEQGIANKTLSALSPNSGGTNPAEDDGLANPLTDLVREDVDRIKLKTTNPLSADSGGGCQVGGGAAIPTALLSLLGAMGFLRLRRRKNEEI